jgi:peptidyl-prolyl cis-trans isomerase SurA
MMKKLIYLIFVLSTSISQAEVVEGIIAVVNNEIVTVSDLKNFSSRIDKNGMLDERLTSIMPVDELKKDKSKQLDFLIIERILDSEVKKQNLNVTYDRVEQQVAEIASGNNMSKSELYAALKNQGVAVSEYQAFLKSSIERQSLFSNEIAAKVRIDDAEVYAEYMKLHPEIKTTVSETTLAHILFNPKKGGDEAALARAQAVLDKIQSAPFENLAEQYSEDPNFSSGGLLGTFKTGEFTKELEEVVGPLSLGDTAGPVKTKMGYHILKVTKKVLIEDPRFEKEKEKIRNRLFESAFKVQLKNWVLSKKEEAYIRINSL